jgi:hypothetical protein
MSELDIPAGAAAVESENAALGCACTLFAVVDSAGSLARNCGAVNSDNLAVGDYRVLFNQDVSNCAWVATIGLPGVGIPPTGQVSVAGLANLNGVAIRTSGDRGAAVNLPFHLAVHCCPEGDED